MPILTNEQIASRKNAGLACLVAETYNRYAKELYGLQYSLNARTSEKLLLLLFAAESWLNGYGSTNIITEKQLLKILENLITLQKCTCKDISVTDNSSTETISVVNYLTGEDFLAIRTEDNQIITL